MDKGTAAPRRSSKMVMSIVLVSGVYNVRGSTNDGEMRAGEILRPDAGIWNGSQDMEREIALSLD